MNIFNKIITWFKTHNKVVVKKVWLEMYENLPQEIKDLYCFKCWSNIFDKIDTNKDECITLWELTKYGVSFGYQIYKHFKKVEK